MDLRAPSVRLALIAPKRFRQAVPIARLGRRTFRLESGRSYNRTRTGVMPRSGRADKRYQLISRAPT